MAVNAVNYVIASDIIDIRVDTPKPEDVFLVDSNVWYWMTYTKASLSNQLHTLRRVKDYSAFVNNAIAVSAKLYRCALSLSELAHTIEKSERKIFEKTFGQIRPKEYRHNHPKERLNVVNEVQAAWGQVKTLASSLDVAINDAITDTVLARFEKECVDGYDLFFLDAMSKEKVIQIITDDGDFSTVSGIKVFTANKNVIIAAQEQGKLIAR